MEVLACEFLRVVREVAIVASMAVLCQKEFAQLFTLGLCWVLALSIFALEEFWLLSEKSLVSLLLLRLFHQMLLVSELLSSLVLAAIALQLLLRLTY